MQDISTAIELVMINLNEVSKHIAKNPSEVLDLRYVGEAEDVNQSQPLEEVVVALDHGEFCLLSVANRTEDDHAYAKRVLSEEAALYVLTYIHHAKSVR
jgi:hypothetical protein